MSETVNKCYAKFIWQAFAGGNGRWIFAGYLSESGLEHRRKFGKELYGEDFEYGVWDNGTGYGRTASQIRRMQ